MMTKENCNLIREAVKEAGAHLEGKLPDHPGLKKRNPYAHLWERIKFHMGKSYKDCKDSDIHAILAIISHYRENPC